VARMWGMAANSARLGVVNNVQRSSPLSATPDSIGVKQMGQRYAKSKCDYLIRSGDDRSGG
jgi:hypothetical protein